MIVNAAKLYVSMNLGGKENDSEFFEIRHPNPAQMFPDLRG